MTDSHFILPPSDSSSTRGVFIRWERWRLVYNLALICLVVFLGVAGGGRDSDWRRFVGQCVLGAIVANVSYFAGPTTEVSLRWFGDHHRAVAPLLFAGGLALALGLAFVTVTSSLLPF